MASVHKSRKDVLNRLARMEGHIRGLRKMVEEDRSCPEILLQIVAVRAALNKVGQIVLEDHIETCLTDAVKLGDTERYLSELREALLKFV